RAAPDAARLQRLRARRDPARGGDRQPHHPGRRIDLARGPAAARRLPRLRDRLLLRVGCAAVDAVLLIASFAVILAGALLFTNAVEWVGHRAGLGEGAVGSLLAAVGTAMPETMISIVALLDTA